MNIEQTLGQIGLNKNETKVYLALLKSGITQAGPLVKATRLHRMLVYNALQKLIDEGLAQTVHKKNIKLFQASDPSILIEKTERLYESAKGIMNDLRKLQDLSQDVVNVRTLIGSEGFQTNLHDVVESASRQNNKEIRIIGGAKDTDFYKAVGAWYPEYIKLLQKYKVSKRLIAPASASQDFKKKFAKEGNNKLRTVSQGLSSPTYTRITKEMVTIEIYHPQIVIIQIKNRAIAQSYLDSFELLWKSAK